MKYIRFTIGGMLLIPFYCKKHNIQSFAVYCALKKKLLFVTLFSLEVQLLFVWHDLFLKIQPSYTIICYDLNSMTSIPTLWCTSWHICFLLFIVDRVYFPFVDHFWLNPSLNYMVHELNFSIICCCLEVAFRWACVVWWS